MGLAGLLLLIVGFRLGLHQVILRPAAFAFGRAGKGVVTLSADLDLTPSQSTSMRRFRRSYRGCDVRINYQLEKDYAPDVNVAAGTAGCQAIRNGDSVAIHYIPWQPLKGFAVLDEDYGYSRNSLILAVLCIGGTLLIVKWRGVVGALENP
jgi:hypothetical protein